MRTRRGLAGVAALLAGVAAIVLVIVLSGVVGGEESVEVGAGVEATAPPVGEPTSPGEDGPELVSEPPASGAGLGTGQRDGAGDQGAGALVPVAAGDRGGTNGAGSGGDQAAEGGAEGGSGSQPPRDRAGGAPGIGGRPGGGDRDAPSAASPQVAAGHQVAASLQEAAAANRREAAAVVSLRTAAGHRAAAASRRRTISLAADRTMRRDARRTDPRDILARERRATTGTRRTVGPRPKTASSRSLFSHRPA